MLQLVTFCTLALGFFLLVVPTESCNEAVCASVVSKCMLTQSCKCDLKNCSCCKECSSCLSYLYTECCSCVDMCPKPNDTGSPLSKESHVGEFTEYVEGLFQALTIEPDLHKRWTTITFPQDHDLTIFNPKPENEIKYHLQSVEQDVDSFKPNKITFNCTVAYMSQCMSYSKCKASCHSMGATSYRWFHNGCCECVGRLCINFGINESRCLNCSSAEEDDDLPPLSDDELDYDEDMDFEDD